MLLRKDNVYEAYIPFYMYLSASNTMLEVWHTFRRHYPKFSFSVSNAQKPLWMISDIKLDIYVNCWKKCLLYLVTYTFSKICIGLHAYWPNSLNVYEGRSRLLLHNDDNIYSFHTETSQHVSSAQLPWCAQERLLFYGIRFRIDYYTLLINNFEK